MKYVYNYLKSFEDQTLGILKTQNSSIDQTGYFAWALSKAGWIKSQDQIIKEHSTELVETLIRNNNQNGLDYILNRLEQAKSPGLHATVQQALKTCIENNAVDIAASLFTRVGAKPDVNYQLFHQSHGNAYLTPLGLAVSTAHYSSEAEDFNGTNRTRSWPNTKIGENLYFIDVLSDTKRPDVNYDMILLLLNNGAKISHRLLLEASQANRSAFDTESKTLQKRGKVIDVLAPAIWNCNRDNLDAYDDALKNSIENGTFYDRYQNEIDNYQKYSVHTNDSAATSSSHAARVTSSRNAAADRAAGTAPSL